MEIGYINVFVSNLRVSIDFYTDLLGFTLEMAESQFGAGSDRELEWLIGKSLIQMSK